MSDLTAKRGSTVKKKPRGKPFTGRDDPRSNNKGRPPTGESWAELIKEVGSMTGDQVASFAGVLGREFAKLPKDVTIKTLTVIRVFGALLNDPQPGLLNAFMERVEGKVKDVVEHDGNSEKPIEVIIRYADHSVIAAPAFGATDDQGTGA